MSEPQAFTGGIEDLQNALSHKGDFNHWPYASWTIQTLGETAVAVYQDETAFDQLVKTAGFDQGQIMSSGASQVGIASGAGIAVVAFRGSEEPGDWRDDLKSVWRVPFSAAGLDRKIRCGLGFLRQLEAVSEDLETALRRIQGSGRKLKVFVCGHSLGAAVATLAVPELGALGFDVALAGLFESPRVFGKDGADWFDRLYKDGPTVTWRIVNVEEGIGDLIRHLPPSSWPFSFRHVGRPAVLAGDGFSPDWDAYDAAHPLSLRLKLRPFTRLARAAKAHSGERLVAKMRRIIRDVPSIRDDRMPGWEHAKRRGTEAEA